MVNPTGYTALDLVGYTDKGDYVPSDTYVKNDLVNHNGSKWRCLIDDTTATTPSEGLNWTVFIAGGAVSSQTLAAGSTTVTFTSIPTSGDHLISFYTSNGINYKAIDTSTAGQVTLTFEAQSGAITVYCEIREV